MRLSFLIFNSPLFVSRRTRPLLPGPFRHSTETDPSPGSVERTIPAISSIGMERAPRTGERRFARDSARFISFHKERAIRKPM